MIDQETLRKWTDWSKRDDACNLFVPSDIRQMLGQIERQQRDHVGAHRVSMATIRFVEDRLEQAERDIRTVLTNLRYLEEVTGEALEGEDAEIVKAIEYEYPLEPTLTPHHRQEEV